MRLLVFVPLVASFHAVCFFLDGVLFPGLHRVRVRDPVFLVGHARSGTTLLHRLMSRDAERFSSFMLYELYFPSLLQKRAIRALAACDRRWLGGFFERRVQAWEQKRYAATQDIHAMGLTKPEEDDFGAGIELWNEPAAALTADDTEFPKSRPLQPRPPCQPG